MVKRESLTKKRMRSMKEKMESELPQLKWYPDSVIGLIRVRGYEGKKRMFKKEKMSVVVGYNEPKAGIFIYDSRYLDSARELGRRIDKGFVFENGFHAVFSLEY